MNEPMAPLIRRGLWTLRRQGPRQLARKITKMAYDRLGDGLPELCVEPEMIADSLRLQLPVPSNPPPRDRKLIIGWVCSPPALGSGGHTTMFRMVRALEEAGHVCRIYLYDRHRGDLNAQRRAVRTGWPEVSAEVLNAADLATGGGHSDLDACLATSWESAHVLATLGTTPMRRLYFIQDYEPYFHPRGSEYALAQDSYRFGFRCIALGKMVADRLVNEVGIEPEVTQFGCDTSIYRIQPGASKPRNGVVCYARPGTPRRGYWLARLALQEFHRQHPDVPIYVYGGEIADLGFPVEVFPRLTPAELNVLYNRCIAGLALSYTNISLVAEELLSAGVVAVVNDTPEPRADLDNPHVVWAYPTPQGIAQALGAAVIAPDIESRARSAAASVRSGWAQTQREVVRMVEDETYGPR